MIGDVDPAEVARDMLKEALPGFESRIDAAHNAVAIRGALPIGANVSREALYWAIPSTHFGLSVPMTREIATEAAAPVVRHIVEEIQHHAIGAVNLEPVIRERERVARMQGEREGHAAGRSAGITEGTAAERLRLAHRFAGYVGNDLVFDLTGIDVGSDDDE